MKDHITEAPKYRRLEEGEIVQEGDEVDICNDGWRDPSKWVRAEGSIGQKAPYPYCPSHRQFRRKIEPNPQQD
tara:strand:- start:341 stop:559 length:219 start_codon:yes stop_codon:yes gene_type:complete